MRIRHALAAAATFCLAALPLAAQNRATGALEIYFVDTEGGQATLYVSPTGESVLVDTGNPGERDHSRIMATLAEAGVTRLDYVILTHYHVDHIGGLEELARHVPIGTFVDHGPSLEPAEQVQGFQARYAALAAGARRLSVKPGDRLPVAGLDWRVVASGGQVLDAPLQGAGSANAACAGFTPMNSARPDDNAGSVGSVIAYGRFRTLNLGDLLWNVEHDLMCPRDRIGPIDLYLTTHHGLGTSGSAMVVHAVRPRVAVMNNGTRKGGAPSAFQILHTSPGLEDLWQLHWSHNGGIEHNAPGAFIANVDDPATLALVLNPPPAQPTAAPAPGVAAAPAPPRATAHVGPAHSIHVTARADGSFTVTNSRNGFAKTYAAE